MWVCVSVYVVTCGMYVSVYSVCVCEREVGRNNLLHVGYFS